MYTYHKFYIKKKSGGIREILAPSPELKEKQQEILSNLYKNKIVEKTSPYAYGFIPGKSIYDNAKVHASKKFILNIDIQDFFPSCKKTTSIMSLLGLKEEEFNLLFHEDKLPQGAPTSPIVSNLYLKKVDIILPHILRVRISDDIHYSRYADDITISSNSKAIFSKTCMEIIKDILHQYGGFKINTKKTRFMTPSSRKEVTGLVVNSGTPTVSRKIRKNIRAAIHNITTSKITPDKNEINKIKGQLSFCMQVPAHRQWATELLRKLDVNIDNKPNSAKIEHSIPETTLRTAIKEYARTENKNKLDLSDTDFYKVIARSTDTTDDQKITALSNLKVTNKNKKWIARKLRYNTKIVPDFIDKAIPKLGKETVAEIIQPIWKYLPEYIKVAILFEHTWLKEKIRSTAKK